MWQLDGGKRTYLPRLGGAVTAIRSNPADPAQYTITQGDNTVRVVRAWTPTIFCPNVSLVQLQKGGNTPWSAIRRLQDPTRHPLLIAQDDHTMHLGTEADLSPRTLISTATPSRTHHTTLLALCACCA